MHNHLGKITLLPLAAALTLGGMAPAFAEDSPTSTTQSPEQYDPMEHANQEIADQYDTPAEVPWKKGTQAQYESVLAQINDARRAQNLPPVKYNTVISDAAQAALEEAHEVNMSADPRYMVPEVEQMIQNGLPEGYTNWGSIDHGGTTLGVEAVQDLSLATAASLLDPDVTHLGIAMMEYHGDGGGEVEVNPEEKMPDLRSSMRGLSLTVVYASYPSGQKVEGSYDTITEALAAPPVETRNTDDTQSPKGESGAEDTETDTTATQEHDRTGIYAALALFLLAAVGAGVALFRKKSKS